MEAAGAAGAAAAAEAALHASPYPAVLHLCAPRHTHPEDLPMLLFDINNAANDLRTTNAKRLDRAGAIAPVLIREQIPVLPLGNPETGISHHRIRLQIDDTEGLVVELLIRDTDLYLVGFRRGIEVGQEAVWGDLFVFNDLYSEVPQWLQPVKMGLFSSHTIKPDLPGPEAMVQMFYTLADFAEDVTIMPPDGNGIRRVRDLVGNRRKNMLAAMGTAILVFCEALRFKTICNEVIQSLEGFEYSTEMSTWVWDLIHTWKKISRDVLSRRRTNRQYTLGSPVPDKEYYTNLGFQTMNDLIGVEGELRICSLGENAIYIATEKRQEKLLQEHPQRYFADPGFLEDEEGGGQGQGQGRGRGRGRGRGAQEGRGRGVRGRGRGVRGRGGA